MRFGDEIGAEERGTTTHRRLRLPEFGTRIVWRQPAAAPHPRCHHPLHRGWGDHPQKGCHERRRRALLDRLESERPQRWTPASQVGQPADQGADRAEGHVPEVRSAEVCR